MAKESKKQYEERINKRAMSELKKDLESIFPESAYRPQSEQGNISECKGRRCGTKRTKGGW